MVAGTTHKNKDPFQSADAYPSPEFVRGDHSRQRTDAREEAARPGRVAGRSRWSRVMGFHEPREI